MITYFNIIQKHHKLRIGQQQQQIRQHLIKITMTTMLGRKNRKSQMKCELPVS